jgi:hypothetical protein
VGQAAAGFRHGAKDWKWPQRGAEGAKNHASLSAAKSQPNRHRILQEATEEIEAMAADKNRWLNSEF